MKDRIAIVGSGEYANQIRDFIDNYSDYEFAGFIDNDITQKDVLCNDDEVLTNINRGVVNYLFLGIGYARFDLRKKLFEKFKQQNIPFATLIHPTAFVHCTAKIGEGCYIGPKTMVLKDAVLEDNVGLMTNVLVGHNDHIGAHTYISGMSALAGYVEVGSCCFLGLNSTVRDFIKIADYTTIGCASNVVKDITESNYTLIGNPARILK